MDEVKNMLEKIKCRFMTVSKATRIIIVVILLVMVIGIGAADMLVGHDGPGFGDDGPGFGGEGQEIHRRARLGTRSLSSSFLQLGMILIGIVVVALLIKPKKTPIVKQQVLGLGKERIEND